MLDLASDMPRGGERLAGKPPRCGLTPKSVAATPAQSAMGAAGGSPGASNPVQFPVSGHRLARGTFRVDPG